MLGARGVGVYLDTMPVVPDLEGCCWRVMADLLADQLRRTRFVIPLAEEDLAQEWIERLQLLPLAVVIFGRVLIPQRADEPLQDHKSPLLRVLLPRRCDEETRVFRPVGAVLDN